MNAVREEVGFTLVEMMVVVALMAILATIAVPSMSGLVRRNAIDAACNELYGLLQYARGEAISRGQRVSVTATGSDAWTGALEVQAIRGDQSSILRHYESLSPSQVQASATKQAISTLSFYANGSSSGVTVITFCHTASPTTTGKSIEVSRSGQVSAPKDATCG